MLAEDQSRYRVRRHPYQIRKEKVQYRRANKQTKK